MPILRFTYVRVLADLLDRVFMEVTGVSHQGPSNIERTLETLKELIAKSKFQAEEPLLQIRSPGLLAVDVLHPALVNRRCIGIDVLLKNNNIGVWNLFGVCR
jgi:hypothetical protein